ncbi:hypothetical protein ACFUTX_13655 [Microbacterium sp. NPDC057407]|uniref:hypothetical protein n=1 Tax=Microbacterium sp. NPDC057407 TaxID=3346120 RepID=UPI0036716E68
MSTPDELEQHDDDRPGDAREATAVPQADETSHEAVGIGVMDSAGGRDHHGQDEGRDTLTVSEAQRTKNGLGSEQEQRLPAMAQNDASAVDKVAGIVAQTRQDLGSESVDRVAQVLAQRFDQSGVSLPESEVRELAQQIATGDTTQPDQS